MTTVTIEAEPINHPELCETEDGEWCFFCLDSRCWLYDETLSLNEAGLFEKLDTCKKELEAP